jgi:hypothetical protein
MIDRLNVLVNAVVYVLVASVELQSCANAYAHEVTKRGIGHMFEEVQSMDNSVGISTPCSSDV